MVNRFERVGRKMLRYDSREKPMVNKPITGKGMPLIQG